MTEPAILVIDDDPHRLGTVEGELRKRYGRDYLIVSETSAAAALNRLGVLKASNRPVALLLAGSSAAGFDAADLLAQAHSLHPAARRGVLVPRDGPGAPRWRVPAAVLRDRTVAMQILRAMSLGAIDAFLPTPEAVRDEAFHQAIGELLDEWTRETAANPPAARIVGDRWSARSHELRDILGRSSIPFEFHAADSEEGRRLLGRAGYDDSALPIVFMYSGEVLIEPSLSQIAEVFQLAAMPTGTLDVVIVGAGPAGLSAAVYAASEGLSTLLLEREAVGGQAGSSSRIRNYLGFPRGVTGAELATRAFEQAWLFGAAPTVARSVTELRQSDGRYLLTLSDGAEIAARSVVIATGVAYRTLDVPSLGALTGAGVFYGAAASEAQAMAGQQVFVAGGGNSAGQAAIHLARYAERVTILVRGGSLAASMSGYLITQIDATPNIDVRYRVEVVGGEGSGRLEALVVREKTTGATETVPAVALFVLIGATPHTAWLPEQVTRDGWGFVVTGGDLVIALTGDLPSSWPLRRPPLALETSMPGVFAAGDVRHRSVKRVASAVGEGSIASTLVGQYLQESDRPD